MLILNVGIVTVTIIITVHSKAHAKYFNQLLLFCMI